MIYTEDELMELPMNILTNVDIRSKEEEDLVQRIINKRRLETAQVVEPMQFPSSMTDNMTIEKERELQAKIDARNEAARKQLEGPPVDSKPEGREEPEPVVEPEPVIEPIVEPTVRYRPTYHCVVCDSRSPAHHKKTCEMFGQKMPMVAR